MKNNNPGCLGWGIAIFALLWLLSLAITYWYLIVAVIVIYLIFYAIKSRKEQPEQATHIPEPKASSSKDHVSSNQARKSNHTDLKHIEKKSVPSKPSPKKKSYPVHRDYKELYDYLAMSPKIVKENNKLVNKRTGCPLAKQSSIELSINQFRQLIALPKNNYFEEAENDYGLFYSAIHSYFSDTYIPYYYIGIIAYKRGDWDKAERWWLSILNLCPCSVSKKLAIMYRKQKRFNDVVILYTWALQLANEPLLDIEDSEYQEIADSLDEARKKAEQNSKKDKSIGLIEYPNRADMKLALKLKEITDSNAQVS